MENNYIQYLVIILVVTIALFFILREVNCWYWKINQRIKLMEEQNRLLNLLVNQNTEHSRGQSKSETSEITDKTKTSVITETSDARIQEIVPVLKELIDKEKNKGVFDKSVRQELINRLEEICQSKNNCIQLLQEYQTKFNSDLIEDLKKLSSSYASIKESLYVFIKFEIIEPEFPHKTK